MIAAPSGWRTNRRGGAQVLRSPDHEIEYRELVRPLLGVDEMVAAELAREPGFAVDSMDQPERLVTDEGEYAALFTCRGTVDGRPARRALGLVFADDYYAALLGRAARDERFGELTDELRGLILADAHMLGLRRRRFVYQAPQGFAEVAGDFETSWLAPDAAITVWRAWPHSDVSPSTVEQLVADADSSPEFTVLAKLGPHAVTTESGLSGAVWDVVGREPGGAPQLRMLGLLQDDRYLYPARLETPLGDATDDTRRAFLAMLGSVQGIPRPRRREAADTAQCYSWVA